ncbi:hypothetical protein CR513_32597, partial [Mucuna pruriens]
MGLLQVYEERFKRRHDEPLEQVLKANYRERLKKGSIFVGNKEKGEESTLMLTLNNEEKKNDKCLWYIDNETIAHIVVTRTYLLRLKRM